jgi:hypothetical protein
MTAPAALTAAGISTEQVSSIADVTVDTESTRVVKGLDKKTCQSDRAY